MRQVGMTSTAALPAVMLTWPVSLSGAGSRILSSFYNTPIVDISLSTPLTPPHPHPSVVSLLFNHCDSFIVNPGGRSLAWIAGSKRAGVVDGLCVVCCQVEVCA